MSDVVYLSEHIARAAEEREEAVEREIVTLCNSVAQLKKYAMTDPELVWRDQGFLCAAWDDIGEIIKSIGS